jgi:hypothetical protein
VKGRAEGLAPWIRTTFVQHFAVDLEALAVCEIGALRWQRRTFVAKYGSIITVRATDQSSALNTPQASTRLSSVNPTIFASRRGSNQRMGLGRG